MKFSSYLISQVSQAFMNFNGVEHQFPGSRFLLEMGLVVLSYLHHEASF